MDKVLLLDGEYIKGGHISVSDKPGPEAELNPDVVKAHLAEGERWWG
jgi:L-alanine-DL-glutamate epimerase-like enolase superfamily enzyme